MGEIWKDPCPQDVKESAQIPDGRRTEALGASEAVHTDEATSMEKYQ